MCECCHGDGEITLDEAAHAFVCAMVDDYHARSVTDKAIMKEQRQQLRTLEDLLQGPGTGLPSSRDISTGRWRCGRDYQEEDGQERHEARQGASAFGARSGAARVHPALLRQGSCSHGGFQRPGQGLVEASD